MPKIAPLLLSALLAGPAVALATPSLLTNGSFENGPVLGLGSWGNYASLPGWQGAPNSGIELRRNAVGAAQDGTYFVELDTTANSWMTQTVDTDPGMLYTLSWYYSPRIGVAAASNPIEVYWNNVLVATSGGSGSGQNAHQWQPFSVGVAGTGGFDTLKFVATGTSDSFGGSLDNIALVQAVPASPTQAVPEPATLALVLGAVGLLAGRRRAG